MMTRFKIFFLLDIVATGDSRNPEPDGPRTTK
jgi:hypothetical protein